MKLPFRGRSLGDDEYDYEDEDFDPSPPVVRPPARLRVEIPPPAHRDPEPRPEPEPRPKPEPEPEPADEAEPEEERRPALREGEVSADEFVDELARMGEANTAEQNSAWVYLGVLGALFVLIVGFGYGCSGNIGSDPQPMAPAEMLASAEPARLELQIQGDIVTLSGSVPDQAARDQLVALAGPVYGPENVVDSLDISSDTTLENGTLRVAGLAEVGDTRPETFRDEVLDGFGLAERGFDVKREDTVLAPALATVSIDGARVSLSGTLPDEQSVADLSQLASEVWGAGAVDATGLVAGETSWTGGKVNLSGTPVVTDANVVRFSALVTERIGTLVALDTSGLSAGDSGQQVLTAQTTVSTLVTGSPIQFAPDSAEIDPTSDAVLIELAAAVNTVPNTPLEIVGHTDSVGDDQDNLLLSEDRAKAVMTRLATLGVAPGRMTARGEGEGKPVADNATEEGKAQNRRIEFILVGPPTG